MEEIQDVDIESLTKEKLEDLTYVDWVLKEALRFDPPTDMLPYFAEKDVVLKGKHRNYLIPANTNCSALCNFLHFNPETWHRPMEFLPERWNPESPLFKIPGTDKRRTGIVMAPFSIGPRSCMGQPLAMVVLKVALIAIFKYVDFDLVPELANRTDPIAFSIGSKSTCKIKVNKVAPVIA